MVTEVRPQIGQVVLPDIREIFRGERLERALLDILGHYEDNTFRKLRQFGYLSAKQKIELILSIEAGKSQKAVNLFRGIVGHSSVSLDYIPPWTEISRDPQFICRRPDAEEPKYVDASSLIYLVQGRMGVYQGEDCKRETILHDEIGYDDIWGFENAWEMRPHKLNTWERPALVFIAVPDTAFVLQEQINLPL